MIFVLLLQMYNYNTHYTKMEIKDEQWMVLYPTVETAFLGNTSRT
jgi:hypothetical protein